MMEMVEDAKTSQVPILLVLIALCAFNNSLVAICRKDQHRSRSSSRRRNGFSNKEALFGQMNVEDNETLLKAA